jgi:NADH dehydrogenase
VHALYHGRIPDKYADAGIVWYKADIHNSDTLIEPLSGVDVVYHLVGIIAETRSLTFDKTVVQGTENLIEACRKNGVKKIIYLSALGTSENAVTKYHKSKWKAEEAVRNSGMEWVIFRPSVVFGPGDSFVNMLAGMIKKLPLTPVIGDGRYELQPVAVGDLVRVMTAALNMPETSGRVFEIGGYEKMEYRRMIVIIKKVLNIRRKNIYFPLMIMKAAAAIMELFLKPAPVTRDQLKMLDAGSTCDNKSIIETFDLSLTKFEDGIAEYVRK